MAAWGKLAFGAMLIALLGIAAATMDAFPGSLSSAQQLLQNNAEAALADTDANWARVHVEGQKAVLTGTAPSPVARNEAVIALNDAAWRGGLVFGGVTAIDSSATTIAPPPLEQAPVLTADASDASQKPQETPAPPPARSAPSDVVIAQAEEAEDLTAPQQHAGNAQDDDAAPTQTIEQAPEPAFENTCQPQLEAVINARKITFATARSEIDAASRAQLLDVAEALEDCPGFLLQISGHTDSRGAESRNRQLSLYRADAVAAYLRSVSVDAERLQTRGVGSSEPLVSNTTADGRAQNRRIEFTLIANLPE